MHLQVDALDVVDGKTIGARELQATIDAGMNDDTAGERLVGIERNLEAFTKLVGDFVPVALGRVRLRQAARRQPSVDAVKPVNTRAEAARR